MTQPTGAELIAAERQRQIEVEGWTPAHDAQHYNDVLPLAACCYALPDLYRHLPVGALKISLRKGFWPFDESWWKPTPRDRIRELVNAGALIAAEIDRLQQSAREVEL